MSNRLINVYYSGGNQNYRVPAVYQYDKGLQLCILGLTTEKIIEVQYGIEGIAQTLNNTPVQDGDKWISDIPNILLAQNREIVCYVCLSDDTMTKTIFHVFVPVNGREKPADYQYTEQEIAGYAKLMAELNEAISEVAELNAETSLAGQSAAQAAETANKAAEDLESVKQSVNEKLESMQTQLDALTVAHDGVLTINDTLPDETGNIVIDADFVGALPNTYTPPVTSVNGQTGDIVISAGGGEADSVSWENVTGKPDSFTPAEHEHTAEEVGAVWVERDGTEEAGLPVLKDADTLGGVLAKDYALKTDITSGLPTGGTSGQVLAKASDDDHDVAWVDQSVSGGESRVLLWENPDMSAEYTAQTVDLGDTLFDYDLIQIDIANDWQDESCSIRTVFVPIDMINSKTLELDKGICLHYDCGRTIKVLPSGGIEISDSTDIDEEGNTVVDNTTELPYRIYGVSGIGAAQVSSGDCVVPTGGTAGQVLAKISDANNDVGWVDANTDTTVYWSEIQNAPTEFTPAEHTHEWDSIENKPTEFTPSTHEHSWEEIAEKPEELTGIVVEEWTFTLDDGTTVTKKVLTNA